MASNAQSLRHRTTVSIWTRRRFYACIEASTEMGYALGYALKGCV